MTQDELAQLEKEVAERTVTSGNKKYNALMSDYNYSTILDDWNNPARQESEILNSIYLEHKKKYSDADNNAFYNKITNAAPKIEDMITQKATEYAELIKNIPKEETYRQYMYTKITGIQNNADKAWDKYKQDENQIVKVISRLNKLQEKINRLLPIYAPQQTAGKRKTRRNKNKKRKPIKKQQKSKRRR